MSEVMGVSCPTCIEGPPRRPREIRLILIEHNYSGCGVDMAYCPKCGRGYCISYKVDQVTHVPDFDYPVEKVR